MPVADRRHALDVSGRLLAAGIDDPDVLCAALLHDVAKGHRMRLWHRVVGRAAGGVRARGCCAASPAPTLASWRHPFHLYLHHADLSADDGGGRRVRDADGVLHPRRRGLGTTRGFSAR